MYKNIYLFKYTYEGNHANPVRVCAENEEQAWAIVKKHVAKIADEGVFICPIHITDPVLESEYVLVD